MRIKIRGASSQNHPRISFFQIEVWPFWSIGSVSYSNCFFHFQEFAWYSQMYGISVSLSFSMKPEILCVIILPTFINHCYFQILFLIPRFKLFINMSDDFKFSCQTWTFLPAEKKKSHEIRQDWSSTEPGWAAEGCEYWERTQLQRLQLLSP